MPEPQTLQEAIGGGGIIAVSNVGLDKGEKRLFGEEFRLVLEQNKPKECLKRVAARLTTNDA